MVINVDKLVEMYNSGMGYEQIGREISRSQRWVGKLLKGKIIPRPAIRKAVIYEPLIWSTKDERDKLICDLYNQGFGSFVISKKLEIGKRTVLKILNKNNISRDRKYKSLRDYNDDINKRYESGMSCAEISKLYNVSSDIIKHYIKNPRQAHDAMSIIPFEKQEEVIKLYVNDKWSTYKIAEYLGCHPNSVQHFIKRKGISIGLFTTEWKIAVQRGLKTSQSNLERKLCNILDTNDIQYITQFELGDFRFDFAINNGDILIEVQGSYWHTKPQRRQRDIKKASIATNNNKKLLIIWDYQLSDSELIIDKINCAISPPVFDYKGCKISKIDFKDAKNLLNRYHYQQCGRSGITYGLYYGEQIIACCVFARPLRLETAIKQNLNYNQIYELTRLIVHPKFQARNLCSWFVSRCVKMLSTDKSIKKLISFADPTFGHIGTIYKSMNWMFDGKSNSSYWYYHRKQNKIIHKKTIWNAAKIANISETEYYQSKHLIKVIGQPKLRFILDIN